MNTLPLHTRRAFLTSSLLAGGGIVLAATADEALGETINLGSGSELSIRDLAQAVFAAVADDSASLRFDAVRPGDLHRLCAATDKARRLLGFSPTVSFSEGP